MCEAIKRIRLGLIQCAVCVCMCVSVCVHACTCVRNWKADQTQKERHENTINRRVVVVIVINVEDNYRKRSKLFYVRSPFKAFSEGATLLDSIPYEIFFIIPHLLFRFLFYLLHSILLSVKKIERAKRRRISDRYYLRLSPISFFLISIFSTLF